MDALPDGIYFGLPDDDYHAQPRLSASGIKNLLVSPMDFWARSWLNPAARNDDDEPEWAIKGRAYHARICEGKEVFYQRYVAELDCSEIKDLLRTADDLKSECRAMELKVGGNKDELVERLLAAGCKKPIYDVMVDEHKQEHAGKTFLPADWIYDIELAAACIEKHPTLCKCFSGGYPEVSILWTAEVERNDGSGELFNVPMKMRADYLKPAAIVDLKTYANKMRKPLDRAVYYTMAAERYHLQTAVYYDGLAAAKNLPIRAVTGAVPSQAWMDALHKHDKQFVFVFQQKGVAPVASGYVMQEGLGLISVGKAQVREAQQQFHDCLTHYGAAPWIMDRPLQQVSDQDVPQFATE
jgi:hypothetical protein